ncbi:MAG TPA: anti-sigma regulatory factor [Gemmatimonadales bacterium]|nr:anti-sigma regulatory factor [Gemmatimonadales bacterium]
MIREWSETAARVVVEDPSQVGETRRMATALADRLGLDHTERGRVGIVATEVARNLIHHAGGGEVVLVPVWRPGRRGLSVIGLDRGPGIPDLAVAMRDGYSTAGTPGTGLGAIARQSDLFDAYSIPGRGTAVLAHVCADLPPRGETALPTEAGAISLAKRGEEVCGDAWAVVDPRLGALRLFAVDGLGHGGGAAQAAIEAVRVAREHSRLPPAELLQRAHAALRHTRGAAVGIADLLPGEGLVRFAGVGNVAGVIWDGESSRSMVSHNGTVGHELRKVQEFTYPVSEGGLVIVHTDGLRTGWAPDRYPGLAMRHPLLVAAVLYRDHDRDRDDVTVLVAPARPRNALN